MATPGGYTCCVPTCTNRSKINKDLSWHSFPNDSSLSKIWLMKVKGKFNVNIKISKHTRVCSEHFHVNQYRPFMKVKKKLLKPGSIPCVFPWNSNNPIYLEGSENVNAFSSNQHPQQVLDYVADESEELLDIVIGDNNDPEMPSDDNIHCTEITDTTNFLNSTAILEESISEFLTFNGPNISTINTLVKSPNNTESFSSAEESNLRLVDLERQIASLKNQIKQRDAKVDALTEGLEMWKIKAQKTKSRLLNVSMIKENDENCMFYTGLPNYGTFKGLLDYLENKAANMQYWNGSKTKEDYDRKKMKPGWKRQLSLEEEFFLVLLRLRLGMPLKELSRVYSMSEASISTIITTWIHLLYYELQLLCPFPSTAAINKTRPQSFHSYPNTRLILDATEFRVERPSSISAQRATFSSYKNYNTFKCLIGISPHGMVTFVSKLYGGATSDRYIVEDCKVLELLESGNDVMADKGFEIETLLPEGVTLNIPPQFRASKVPQMAAKDVVKTKNIASVRVHVERAIRRIKTFHIFDSPIPLSMADEAEKIIMVCALLTNFSPALIRGSDLSLLEEDF